MRIWMIMVVLAFLATGVSGKVITVDDNWSGADYSKIQDAIDNANDGDVIRFTKGSMRRI